MILFLNFLLKIKTHSHNLKVFSKSFHDETVRYKKVFCPVALLKRGMLKRWEFRVTRPLTSPRVKKSEARQGRVRPDIHLNASTSLR